MVYLGAILGILWVLSTELMRHALVAPIRWARHRGNQRSAGLIAWGHTLRRICERAGPTFVKLGQVVSSRPDLFPIELVRELAHLQDNVSPVPPNEILAVLESDLRVSTQDCFVSFDKVPVAAASVSQVHRAVLEDGSNVAVKIQRPGIAERFNSDLAVLTFFARMVHLLPGMRNLDVPSQIQEFSNAVVSQLDFRQERENSRMFSRLFKSVDWVRLPRIHEELSGDRVIVMEFIEGDKVQQFMEKSGGRQRADLADRMYRLYVTMSLKLRVLHADLHPGNLLIDEEERFVLLDTGLAYSVPKQYTEKYYRTFLAISTFDGELLARTYLHGQNGYSDDELRAIYKATHEITSLMAGAREGELDFSEIWGKFMALMRDNGVKFDREMTMLAVADSTFAGMAKQLDVKFDYIGFMMSEGPRLILQEEILDPADTLNQELISRFMEMNPETS